MSLFLCSSCPGNEPASLAIQARFVTHPAVAGLRLRCEQFDGLWVMLGIDEAGPEPRVTVTASWIVIGTARLDEPPGVDGGAATLSGHDVERLARAVEANGPEALTRVGGEFAVVLFERRTQRIVAIRDALGVHSLYYERDGERIACSSRATLLARGDRYDIGYLAAFVANAAMPSDQTPFAGVRAVPPGHLLSASRGALSVQRYWDPGPLAARADDTRTFVNAAGLVGEFRARFATAVSRRLTGRDDVWAQLSGGLDSSSVVSTAAALARERSVPFGVAGTVTLVDRQGTGGDEREYSDAVAGMYGLRNEQIVDSEWWDDDGERPPLTDHPTPSYVVYARDRRLARLVRNAGGRVVLSGYGSDQYLGGSALFFADWLATGRAREALREMARWAMIGRVSFWRLAFHNAFVPLAPAVLRARVVRAADLPTWVPAKARRAFDLAARHNVASAYDGPRGRKYHSEILHGIAAIPHVLAHHQVIQSVVEERHPFLDRELVEFALALPAAACAQPGARKWVLREAMRGVLPEPLRTRRGKGSMDGRTSWMLEHRRHEIEAWLRDPILGQLGCLDPSILLASLTQAVNGADHLRSMIIRALAGETWLRARAGLSVTLAPRAGAYEAIPPGRGVSVI